MCGSSSSDLGDRGSFQLHFPGLAVPQEEMTLMEGTQGHLQGRGLQQCGKELPWEKHQWLHQSVVNISDAPYNIASKMEHVI